jgi:hypothetical protein
VCDHRRRREKIRGSADLRLSMQPSVTLASSFFWIVAPRSHAGIYGEVARRQMSARMAGDG